MNHPHRIKPAAPDQNRGSRAAVFSRFRLALAKRSTAMLARVGLFLLLAAPTLSADPAEPAAKPAAPKTAEQAAGGISPDLQAALENVKLPGVKINIAEWSVDVESRVCLTEGLLELIACTKETKVHESIIAVEAQPSHIHAALLLLGASPGSPAMRQQINPDNPRIIDLPPRGAPIDVFVVVRDDAGKEIERPISDFIKPADDTWEAEGEEAEDESAFPTHTFLFTGSLLVEAGEGPRKYLCDESGHVITIATFGDEMLALPGIHGHSNGSLMWQVNGENLPALDSPVILRLRPQTKPPASSGSAEKP